MLVFYIMCQLNPLELFSVNATEFIIIAIIIMGLLILQSYLHLKNLGNTVLGDYRIFHTSVLLVIHDTGTEMVLFLM